jgi:hypothetical protein
LLRVNGFILMRQATFVTVDAQVEQLLPQGMLKYVARVDSVLAVQTVAQHKQ